MAKRLLAAVVGFIAGGVVTMFLLGYLLSFFNTELASVKSVALVAACICGVVGFCYPKLGFAMFTSADL